MQLAKTLVEDGNPNAVSDAGVAAEVALAGVRGACLNVMINLNGIDDELYCESIQKDVDELISDANKLHKAIFKKIRFIIKG